MLTRVFQIKLVSLLVIALELDVTFSILLDGRFLHALIFWLKLLLDWRRWL